MGTHTFHGMAFKEVTKQVTVPMHLYCFPHGIDHTWPSTRYLPVNDPSFDNIAKTIQQLLWTNAQQIAATYPAAQRSTYQTAAPPFRVPYWDWAINSTMPDPVNDPMITITTPQGTLSITNPLYNYTFHPHPSAADFPPTDTVGHPYHPLSLKERC